LFSLLVTVRPPSGWQPLSSLESIDPEVVVVALLVEATRDSYAQALRFGAVCVSPAARTESRRLWAKLYGA
jgi:hypothetical protein